MSRALGRWSQIWFGPAVSIGTVVMSSPTGSTSARRGTFGAERPAGLDEGLQTAEHPVPTTAAPLILHGARREARHGRSILELVRHRQPGDAESAPVDLPRDPGEAFRRQLRADQHPPAVHEPPGRLNLENDAVRDRIRHPQDAHLLAGETHEGAV